MDWMENTGSVNQGVLALKTSSVSLLGQMNYTKKSTFLVDNRQVLIRSWAYSDGSLRLYFDYEFTLEHLNASLAISLDPHYFDTTTMTHSFTFVVDSVEYELIYIESGETAQLLETAFYWIAVIITVLSLLSMLVHPMMGA